MTETGSVAAWLIGLPLGGAPIVYLTGRLGRAAEWPTRPRAPRWATLTILALASSAWAAALGGGGNDTWRLGQTALRVDGLGLLVGAMALVLGSLVVVFAGPDLRGRAGEEKFYALVLVEIGAVLGLASATDLFNMWIWFEVMAVASYVLVAFYHDERAGLEASVKYLVQGATGSTLAMLGIALVLAQTGSLDLASLERVAGPSPMLLAACGLLLAGFGTKAGLVPFHTWLPDAYAQAPSGVSALLSGLITKLGLIAALRAAAALSGVTPSWPVALVGLGAVGILAGNLLALRQSQLKRLLAYSSLAHLGYALLGIGIGVWVGQPTAAAGGVFHLLTHGLMSGAAFLAVGALLYGLSQQRANGRLGLADMAGCAQRYPLVALALSLAVLGLAGLPPLAGFMSKWQIFTAGFDSGSPILASLVVFAALNSVLSLAYYAPVVVTAYRAQPSLAVIAGQPMPLSMTLPLVGLSLASLVLGVWPALASGLVASAAAALVRAVGS
jgi:multicomponent Na+:H+ antiporter subunit D